ncbi:MAG: DNRLRE domain-containing protein [Chloroflexi bacterium]|nr:DNRLRE domain-containing protein [Chloroflexota bacterium]
MIPHPRSKLLTLLILIGLLSWPIAESAARPTAADAGQEEWLYLRYLIDRSAVPEWVTFRELTLRIEVGDAERVWAWADGALLPVRHDRATGTLLVTTSAEELVIALQGQGLVEEEVGWWSVATLRDDKLWAYSLTFDDGEYSVYTHAWPELARFGYTAGVAVIGRWLDSPDAVASGYCGVEEIEQLLAAGWSVFNHSYNHYDGLGNISLQEAQLCQEAIYNRLGGYRATVFTVPYTNRGWQPIIDTYGQSLGLQLMQLYADNGERIAVVDGPFPVTDRPYHLGRRDIKLWVEGEYNIFDQAHGRASGPSPQHVWVSLHGHNVNYEEDWCAVAESSAYLYRTYGAGGSDEVWVAPVDQVYQYLVTRTYAVVQRMSEPSRDPGPTAVPPHTIRYRAGDGASTWLDTYIQEWFPTGNFSRAHSLLARSGVGGRASPLWRIDFMPPDGEATVLQARFSVYVSGHTNPAAVDLAVYPLLRPWDAATVTWQRPTSAEFWGLPGARLAGVDHDGEWAQGRGHIAHIRDCSTPERWYTLDITDIVSRWVEHPEENYGFLLIGDDRVSTGVSIISADHPDREKRPLLEIIYSWPTPPATVTPTATASPTPTTTATATPTRTSTPLPTVPTPTRLGLDQYLPLLLVGRS